MITTMYIRQCLRYEPDTGWLIWLVRPGTHFANEGRAQWWNGKFPGTRAGAIRARGRRFVTINNQPYGASRLIWQIVTGEVPGCFVDHKNNDPSDDRWENLRLATPWQNTGNQKKHANSKAEFKGVTRRASGRYEAASGNGPHYRYLGLFGTAEEAHAVYMAAAREAYGEFARAE